MKNTSWHLQLGIGLIMGLVLASGVEGQAGETAKPGVARISDFNSSTGNIQVSHTDQAATGGEEIPVAPPAKDAEAKEAPAADTTAPKTGQCNICPKCNKCHNCQRQVVKSCSQPATTRITHPSITVPSLNCLNTAGAHLHGGVPLPWIPLPWHHCYFGDHSKDCDCDSCRHGHRSGLARLGHHVKNGRFGYFVPRGGKHGHGIPWAGAYHMVYPLNPQHFDPRDGRIYAAQGYGVPMSVPLAPVVGKQYNYGWGIPSSRLTQINRGLRIPANYPGPTPGHHYPITSPVPGPIVTP